MASKLSLVGIRLADFNFLHATGLPIYTFHTGEDYTTCIIQAWRNELGKYDVYEDKIVAITLNGEVWVSKVPKAEADRVRVKQLLTELCPNGQGVRRMYVDYASSRTDLVNSRWLNPADDCNGQALATPKIE